MAVSSKRKRKITVADKRYLWWGEWTFDQTAFDGNQVKVLAEDQSHLFWYGMEQKKTPRRLLFKLRNHQYLDISCPRFEKNHAVITSGEIRQLIEWTHTHLKNNPTILAHYNDIKTNILKGAINEFRTKYLS